MAKVLADSLDNRFGAEKSHAFRGKASAPLDDVEMMIEISDAPDD